MDEKFEKFIIGFDPGLAVSGYGVISISGSRVKHRTHGIIRSSAEEPEEKRLLSLYQSVSTILAEENPAAAGIESIFFSKNVRSAIPVAQARGVILLACGERGIPVYSFSPPQIKQRITGVGHAEKKQIQQMVKFLLGLAAPPESDHAADALAAAYCVWQEGHFSEIIIS
ncbi:MAG: crossover junction endodeoxyribonuclease RuvC [Salinispira sp.]